MGFRHGKLWLGAGVWGSVVALGCAAITGCDTRDVIEENFRDVTSHEAYARSLRQAGLGENRLAVQWSQAAEDALMSPLSVASPFEERGVFDPADPRALGFRIDAERGQRIVANIDFEGLGAGRVFVDLYRRRGDTLAVPFHEATVDVGEDGLDYAVPRTGTFILRVQPEVLYGGEYRVDIRIAPTLAFPVWGRGPSAILSLYGAPRDGGRRVHRGVDIFAPRGTPAIASVAGRVTRVDTTNLGGLVVWLRDDRTRNSIYYAHLDRQLVEEGQRVQPGDTVGTVGNTGNARTTPPHLHFGIYRRREGALNPYAFIEPQDSILAPMTAPVALIGGWVRASTTATVREAARRRGASLAVLEPGTAAEVLGASGGWLRLRLPDASEGYALASQMVAAVNPLTGLQVAAAPPRMAPRDDAPSWGDQVEVDEAPVVGRYGDFGLVLDTDGRAAWVELQDR